MNNLKHSQIDALNRLDDHPELGLLFFPKLKGLKWFNELEKRGYFNPSKNPGPQVNEVESTVIVNSWPVLEYLNNTADEIELPENEIFAKKYIDLIRNVSIYSSDNGTGNYRTWWFFSKLLLHIPVNLLLVSDIEHLVAIWLSDKYGSSLVYREIGSNFLPRLLNNENDHSNILAVKVIELLTEISWHPLRSADSNKIEANFKDNEYIANEIFQSHSRLVG